MQRYERMGSRVAELPRNRMAHFLEKPARDKVAAIVATAQRVLTGGRAVGADVPLQPYNETLMYNETLQHNIRDEIACLKAEIRATMPDNPVLAGYKVYSQVDEDGIIRALLNHLPEATQSRTAIEIGCGNGLENNTHLLLIEGFRVCWLDGAPGNIDFIKRELGLSGKCKDRLMVAESNVTRENISLTLHRFCEFLATSEPDLFSLDIDGNDLHVRSRALEMIRPKIIFVEYNGKFPPPLSVTIRYDAQHQWNGDDYQGASLQAFSELLTGYFLACCNIAGANAFFVRNEFRALFPDYPVAALFQPLRTHLRTLNIADIGRRSSGRGMR